MEIIVRIITCIAVVCLSVVSEDDFQYKCPEPDCKCYRDPENHNDVRVYCDIMLIRQDRITFTGVQNEHTTFLSVTCSEAILHSYTWNGMFRHLTNLKGLSISKCRMIYVPEHMFEGLTQLTELMIDGGLNMELHDNAFLDIPNVSSITLIHSGVRLVPRLCEMKLLYGLNFTDNRINNFDHLGLDCANSTALRTVEILDFHYNMVTELPAYVGTVLPNLRRITAADNLISVVSPESLEKSNALFWADFSNNSITELPSNFLWNSPNIKILSLSHNPLRELPVGLVSGRIGYIMLDLNGLNINDDIWEDIANVDIQTLNMAENRIATISKQALRTMPSLTTLDLSNNIIDNITPDTFMNQISLNSLVLSYNLLHRIDHSSLTGLPGLSELSLDSNVINSISSKAFAHLTALTFLNISNNSLDTMPDFSSLTMLTVLDMSYNNLNTLQSKSFNGLNNLLTLRLHYNRFSILPSNGFSHCHTLRQLTLNNNRLLTIESDAFKGLSHMEELNLQFNNISDLGTSLKSLTMVKKLILSHNRIGILYKAILPENVVYLDLSQNKIHQIYPFTFSTLTTLKAVDMSFNRLETLTKESIEISPLTPSKPLFAITGNRYKCDCNLVWLKQYTTGVIAGQTLPKFSDINTMFCYWRYGQSPLMFYKVQESQFLCPYETSCSDKCPCCYFDGCDCKQACPDTCNCFMSHDKSQNIIRCDKRGVRGVPKLPSGSSEIYLDGNNLTTLRKLDFITLSRATILHLNNSNISAIENRSFIGMSSLRVLYLNHNHIKRITAEGFDGIDQLEELYLGNNRLTTIDFDAFAMMKSLRLLHLHNNQLRTIPLNMFTSLMSLTDVRLAGNRWSCDCGFIEPFKETLHRFALKVPDLSYMFCIQNVNGTTQSAPELGRHMIVSTYRIIEGVINKLCSNETADVINGKSDIIVIQNVTYDSYESYHDESKIGLLAGLIAASLLVLLVFIFVFWKRYFLKVWLHSLCGVRIFDDRKQCNEEDKMYDAFMSYSTKDEHYVVHELAPFLEQDDPHYKLCLHYRDFPVGASIAETIIHSVESSRRTIMILSENYLASEWCRYEFQAAFKQALQDRVNRIIVVLLHNIDFSKLDKDLQFYLKTHTYVKYNDPWFREKLKYALPEPKRDLLKCYQYVPKTKFCDTDSYGFKVNHGACDEHYEHYEQPIILDGDQCTCLQGNNYDGDTPRCSNIYEEIGPGKRMDTSPMCNGSALANGPVAV